MRVLQFHTRYRQRGGEDVVVEAEARVLREAGHQVHQFVMENPSSDVAAVGTLALSPWNALSKRRASAAIEHFQPDIAHIHNTWFAMTPSIVKACREAQVPTVMTLHNYRLTCANGLLFRNGDLCELCVGSHPWHAVKFGCYRDSRIQSVPAATTIALHRGLGTWVGMIDCFIVMSEAQREVMIRAGLPARRMVMKPHFVEDPGPRPHRPSASRTVLFVGRLSPEKGIHELVNQWGAAANGLELVVVGSGSLRDGSSASGISWLGEVTMLEARELMKSARALVMPSLWNETMGLVVLEAFSAGLPALVSDRGAPGAIVASYLGDEWTFEPTLQDSFHAGIRLLKNPVECDRAGEIARGAFERDFDVQHAASRLLAVYESVLSKRGDP